MTFLAGFELGILLTVLLCGFFAVRFPKSFASFFNRLAHAPKLAPARASNVQPISEFTPVQRDVVEALIGQGLNRKDAERTVRQVGNYGAVSFDQLFRLALEWSGKAAAQ